MIGFDKVFVAIVKNSADSMARQLFDMLPVGISLFNKKGVLVAVNRRELQTTGIKSKDSLLGMNLFYDSVFSPDIQARLSNEDEFSEWHYYDYGRIGGVMHTTKKGKIRVFSRVKKIRNEKGDLEGYVMINMEDTAMSSEEYSSLVPATGNARGSMELEAVYNEEHKIIALYAHNVDDNAAALFGLTRHQLDSEDLFHLAIYVPFRAEISKLSQPKAKKTFYYYVIRSRKYIRWTFIYMGSNRYQCLMVDITDHMMDNQGLKYSDTVFRTVYDNSPMSILLLDIKRRIEDCNDTYMRMWGYKDKSEVIGHFFPRDPKLDNHPELWKGNKDNFEIEQEYTFDKKIYRMDSSTDKLYLNVRAYKYFMPNGDLRGWIVYLSDITRTKKYEHNLQEQKKEAQEKSNMKSRFIQNMSHDIRTPLNAIVGFSQLLGLPDGSLTEEEKEEYSSHIANNSNMLMMLVDDILNISDVESGNYKITLRPVKFNELCANTLKSVEYRVPAGVKLYYTSDVDDDATFNTDGRRVQQVLINFLTNACKHTQEGEIRLECHVNEKPGQIHFSVIDTGEGVDPSMADDLFQRFTKLNTVEGTGIGLNICQTISQKLGGSVSFDKTYTGGAKFDFYLPAVPHINN